MIGDEAANREFVHIRRDPCLFEPVGQAIYPAREKRTQGTPEQVGTSAQIGRWLRGVRRPRGGLFRYRDRTGQGQIEAAMEERGPKHRSKNDRGHSRRIDHALHEPS